jgi:hypothetical protein
MNQSGTHGLQRYVVNVIYPWCVGGGGGGGRRIDPARTTVARRTTVPFCPCIASPRRTVSGTVVVQWWYSGGTVVAQWWHSGSTVVVQCGDRGWGRVRSAT